MPVMDCRSDGHPGFKWGDEGHCYIYVAGNEKSREAARQKCLKQGAAIEMSKHAQTQHFRAELQHMADAEILDMVGDNVLAELKAKDPHPVIRVYGIGHEGEAKGTMIDGGHSTFQYLQQAIRRMYEKLTSGTSVFLRHAFGTNEHEGRRKVGEVVGKKVVEKAGRLFTMAAVYIYPEFRSEPMDVASIEANVMYVVDADGKVNVKDVESITGIALGDSKYDTPGFPGATMLGAMQAFTNNSKEGNGTMTLEELKGKIREANYKPSDLFEPTVLQGDPVVVDFARKEKQTEYEHAKRVEKALGEERDGRLADSQRHDQELKSLRGELVKSTKGSMLSTLVQERKLTDRQAKYVQSHLADFSTEAADEAKVKSDMTSWMDRQLEQYRTMAEIFGVKEEGEGAGAGAAGAVKVDDTPATGAGAASSDGKGQPAAGAVKVDPADMTAPENNPFIPR